MLARLPLCELPSPLTRASRLGAPFGPEPLLVKRDDLLGRLLGGNKLRKLEYLAAAAQTRGADVLVTSGAPQSNHLCVTATVARMLGLGSAAVVLSPVDRPAAGINERLRQQLGMRAIEVQYGPDPSSRAVARLRVRDSLDQIQNVLRQQGHRPYLIPEGGCSLEGSYALMEAFAELHTQMGEQGWSCYDVFVAVGTGSTYAGLWCGARRAEANVRIRGLSIALPQRRCQTETARAAKILSDATGLTVPKPKELDITDEFVGDGYGVATATSRQAVSAALEMEGLLVDDTYTGKALGGMLAMLQRDRADRPVVFWHTGGVAGALSAVAAVHRPQ